MKLGDCYEAAGRYVINNMGKRLKLVHGEVAGQGDLSDITFGHAWVLDGNNVLDVSNGRNLKIPKALYYALGQVDRIGNYFVYSDQEVLEKTLETGTWGPWDLKTRY